MLERRDGERREGMEGQPPFRGVLGGLLLLPLVLLHRGPELLGVPGADAGPCPAWGRGVGGDGDPGHRIRRLLAGDPGVVPSSPAKLNLLSGGNLNS